MEYIKDLRIEPGSDICKNCSEMALNLNEEELFSNYNIPGIKAYTLECIHRRACEHALNFSKSCEDTISRREEQTNGHE